VTRTSLFADASRKPLLEFDDLNYLNTDYITREVEERFRELECCSWRQRKALHVNRIKRKLVVPFSSYRLHRSVSLDERLSRRDRARLARRHAVCSAARSSRAERAGAILGTSSRRLSFRENHQSGDAIFPRRSRRAKRIDARRA